MPVVLLCEWNAGVRPFEQIQYLFYGTYYKKSSLCYIYIFFISADLGDKEINEYGKAWIRLRNISIPNFILRKISSS